MDSTAWSNFEQTMIKRLLVQAPPAASMGKRSGHNKDVGMSASNSKVYVEHNYVDHYNDPIYRPHDGSSKRRGPRGGVLVPFPEKLYQMFNQISEDGLDDVCSWQPHGRCFVVHQPERFVKEVMPRYFSQTKLTSFQRQVNLYGFRRLTTGTDRNGYYHELFLRGRPDLLKRMTRVRVKGIGCKLAPSPSTEPNLYTMPTCHESKLTTMTKEMESRGGGPSVSAPETLKTAMARSSAPDRSNSSSYFGTFMANKLELSGYATNAAEQVYDQLSGCSKTGSTKTFATSRLPSLVQSSPHQGQAAFNNDVDLTPLPASPTGYLLEMQDDIINLLSSHGDMSGSAQPLEAPSSGNILNDLANFWEI